MDIRIVHGQNFKTMLFSPSEKGSWSAKKDPHPIAELLSAHGVQRAFVPDTDFSGLIARGNEEYHILHHVGDVTLETATSREGTFVDPGEAFIMCTGGCPLIIATDNNHILCVAHAGRDSLLDRQKICSGFSSREDEGVVDQIARVLREIGINPSMTELHGYFGIHREVFTHPLCDEYSRMMHTYVNTHWPDSSIEKAGFAHLDLGALITEQGKKAGFSSVIYSSEIPCCDSEFPTTRSPGERKNLRSLAVVIHKKVV